MLGKSGISSSPPLAPLNEGEHVAHAETRQTTDAVSNEIALLHQPADRALGDGECLSHLACGQKAFDLVVLERLLVNGAVITLGKAVLDIERQREAGACVAHSDDPSPHSVPAAVGSADMKHSRASLRAMARTRLSSVSAVGAA